MFGLHIFMNLVLLSRSFCLGFSSLAAGSLAAGSLAAGSLAAGSLLEASLFEALIHIIMKQMTNSPKILRIVTFLNYISS
ncbi:hypothetical protein BGX38DRAFT_1169259 [Terfezia claveryi]|nr:hypothetical protein BGX38DRAFT_1169259 [Terfezia claveryi]